MKNTTKSKEISGKEIDRKFDNGEDVLEYFDLEHPIIENHSNEQKHVTFIMPECILRIMKFFRVATTRQSNKTRDKTKTCRRMNHTTARFLFSYQLSKICLTLKLRALKSYAKLSCARISFSNFEASSKSFFSNQIAELLNFSNVRARYAQSQSDSVSNV